MPAAKREIGDLLLFDGLQPFRVIGIRIHLVFLGDVQFAIRRAAERQAMGPLQAVDHRDRTVSDAVPVLIGQGDYTATGRYAHEQGANRVKHHHPGVPKPFREEGEGET